MREKNYFKLNFLNDPLLLDNIRYLKNFITANDSLPEEFIILPNNILNLYSALVKRRDFDNNHLRSFPFFRITEDKLREFLPAFYSSKLYQELRRNLSFYFNRKRIFRTESIRKWFKNEIFPAPMIRVISNIVSSNKEEEIYNLSLLINHIEFITDSKFSSKIILPKTIKELENTELAYFVGCSFGDGELNIAEHWQLVDGDSKNIQASLEFIESLKVIANRLFSIDFTKNNPRLREHKYEFWISNKSLCRFLNFFFGMPYGKKKNRIEKPKIFNILSNSTELSKRFWSGMFDTDGCLEKNGYRITLSSATSKIIKDCKYDLENMSLRSKIRIVKQTGVKLLGVPGNYFEMFGKEIGFSHPRKANLYNLKLKKYLI